LVRDKIPDIITRHGNKAIIKILGIDMYKAELRKKLQEEVAEFYESGKIEELVDILEVVYALAAAEGISRSQLEKMRREKRKERGGFDRRIFLIETNSSPGIG
jgi:predicted house-cleaning noncanonical NTP pyrophosphatase (MazG superfamily)